MDWKEIRKVSTDPEQCEALDKLAEGQGLDEITPDESVKALAAATREALLALLVAPADKRRAQAETCLELFVSLVNAAVAVEVEALLKEGPVIHDEGEEPEREDDEEEEEEEP